MKRIALVFIASAIMYGCNSNSNSNDSGVCSVPDEKIDAFAQTIVEGYSGEIKAEYDKSNQRIDLSWKCKTMTVSYHLLFKDLLTDNPTTYADGFLISSTLFAKGVTEIKRMEFKYEGITFNAVPFCSETIDERGAALAGFSSSDKENTECFKMLSNLSGVVTGKFITNKGEIEIPLNDVFNLRGMARSYIIDGGEF